MDSNHIALLEREERLVSCFQTAISLIDPAEERNPIKIGELLDFLAEEYNRVRKDWRARTVITI